MNEKCPFPLIYCEGDPFEVGRQHGSQAKDLIDQSLNSYSTFLKLFSNVEWNRALGMVKKFIPHIETYNPVAMEEMRGIAEGAGKSFEEILVLNARFELANLAAAGSIKESDGCTAVGALPEATASKHLIMGQNWDWKLSSQKIVILLTKKQVNLPGVVTFVEAGTLARIGFNSAGICLLGNGLVSDKWRLGVPTTIGAHKILNQRSLAEAILCITSGGQRAASANSMIGFTGGPLAGKSDGEIIDFETAPTDYNVLYPQEGTIAHANHYTVPNPNIQDQWAATLTHTYMRGFRAGELMRRQRGKITVDSIKEIFTDHFDGPINSLCQHPNLDLSNELQIQTDASIIIDMHAKTMDIAKGPPCENGYVRMTFKDIM